MHFFIFNSLDFSFTNTFLYFSKIVPRTKEKQTKYGKLVKML